MVGWIYDVIDGKQRLETIFKFMRVGRFKRDAFDVKLEGADGYDWFDWSDLKRWHRDSRFAFEAYKIQTVEVTGDLQSIIDLFVRINSTGKRLTTGEKRHAKYYRSPFLREAEHLVTRYHRYLIETRILSAAQIERMKGTELFAEILMSMQNGGPINKKTSLDRAIGNDAVNGNTLARLVREFVKTMNLVRRMFPDLRQIRMRNSAEFYSLLLLVWELERERFALGDRRRSRIAFELLRALSTGVDELRDQLRRAKPAKSSQRAFSDYLLTVQGDTDSSATRERRREILRGLLSSVFARKDAQRLFSVEQRRVLWHSDEKRTCARCGKAVTWSEFSADHVRAWSRGGRTSLRNARIMHRRCNSSKGGR